MISIKGLHKYFNRNRSNEIHVINDVTLDLPERGMVAIFGKSGCGKTTLLNVIGGLDKFADGSVTVAGENMTAGNDDLRNRHIGYIFQNYNLSESQTCYENVKNALVLAGLKDKEEIAARTEAALRGVGMEKYEKRTPDTLSGGQQQRIAIARAIAKGPSIILADEPTGNLDEANTLMIMELLRDIADERLVIIVTHEERLVDRYCDKIIELSDGKVVSVRENSAIGAGAEKNKNDIYLGDLESHGTLSDSGAHVEFYGTTPAEPIRVKIVNTGGRIYLKVESERVQIIDSGSEIRLHSGSYEECVRESTREHVHALPPIKESQRGKCGKLFSFISALKSGYHENFGSSLAQRRGKKALRRCLMLFAVAAVFISAVFGTSIGDLESAGDSYNHNVFYVYTPDGEVSELLNGALSDPASGIDYVRLCESIYGIGNVKRLYLKTASFETFDQTLDFLSEFSASCEYLGLSLASDKRVLAGERDGISDRGLVITTAVADELLENSTLGYIDEYKDLIGLYADGTEVDGKMMRVEGVVEGAEKAVYMGELQLAKYVLSGIGADAIGIASESGIVQNGGECTVAIRSVGSFTAAVGDTVKLHGKSFTVSSVMTYYEKYADYIEATGKAVETDISAWAMGIVEAEHPELSGAELTAMVASVIEARYYEYLDHYYAYLYDFLLANSFFGYDTIELWMYIEQGIDAVKYMYAPAEYYGAKCYYEQYGAYPTQAECLEYMNRNAINVYDVINEYAESYEWEFYDYDDSTVFYGTRFLVSDSDYVELSHTVGETNTEASVTDYKGDKYAHYTLVHSYDPALTEEWLGDRLGHLEAPAEWYIAAIITPGLVYKGIIEDSADIIVAGVAAMAVMLVLMCICMYFIMRSSLLTRVKEIGVYRAIGVSRGNLISRSLVESAVLVSLTVLVGYIATGIFIRVASSMSTLVADAFYYPLPMALAVLAVLVVTSVTCGTLPTVALVAKTPSEILAKYDI